MCINFRIYLRDAEAAVAPERRRWTIAVRCLARAEIKRYEMNQLPVSHQFTERPEAVWSLTRSRDGPGELIIYELPREMEMRARGFSTKSMLFIPLLAFIDWKFNAQRRERD